MVRWPFRRKGKKKLPKPRIVGGVPFNDSGVHRRFKKHKKYTPRAGEHINRLMNPSKNYMEEEVLEHSNKAIFQLMDHEKTTRDNLPSILEGARRTSTGSVESVLKHAKIGKEGVLPAMRILVRRGGYFEEKGYHKVMELLDHPKVTPKNAERLLNIADKYGCEKTMKFLHRDNVTAKNIEERMLLDQKLGRTQRMDGPDSLI
jgi:hypothetical protein